ncbi:type II CRISPR RNA-guided endonuclease Cas9 [Mycoplasmopsis arginini]|uniref:type II CRISPR RNA-guided endonuclease Cas9 n=1 Tax=Mycoplasmopsis arginini TaxID=2094 RepID=UPI002733744C|nr:type II CRISPR RNA-guided endonuclease Cas9 [Mycoplasmopsis arginini]MDP4042867.1 type II CRISPR RNA-guided endonuclease Cas9 [Mycoplasmopsis arginini]
MNKKDVTIGFDLGIASVGWSIIDNKTNDILKLGSRLFQEREKAEDRRNFRNIRRRIRRRKYKKEKFINLVLKNKDIFGFSSEKEIYDSFEKNSENWPNILDLKIKALNQKIEKSEIVWLLHDYLKNRGYFYATNEVNINETKQDNCFPSELLLDFYKENNFFKSNSSISRENGGYTFSNKDWIKEIEHMLTVQEININFSKEYISIFNYVRLFSEGPGSLNSASEYGIYNYDENGRIVKKYTNIWDKTIGKCSLFEDEKVISTSYPSYEIFNLLNNLADIRSAQLFNEKEQWSLSPKNKEELLNNLFHNILNKTKAQSITIKQIEKIYIKEKGLEDISDQLKGKNLLKQFGLNNNLTTLNSINKLLKIIKNFSSEYNEINTKKIWDLLPILDDICLIIEVPRNLDEYYKLFSEHEIIEKLSIGKEAKEDFIKQIISIKELNFNKKGSLSKKAIYLYLSKMRDLKKNSEFIKWNDEELKQIVIERKEKSRINPNNKYIDPFIFSDDILSPAAKQTFEQAIKVLNRIIKLYSNEYNIKSIVVEMPKTKNDKETIEKYNQDNVKKDFEGIIKLLPINITVDELLKKKTKSLLEKLKLYVQQDGIDLYSMQKMDIWEVINYPGNFEIDHIIPYSLSYDNSVGNKVLTTKANNQAKGQKTAMEYLGSLNLFNIDEYKTKCAQLFLNKDTFTKNKNNVVITEKNAENKYKNLTWDNFNESNKNEFINRNLNDTRYAVKLFVETLRKHFDNKETKIIGINGHVTSYFRNISFLRKDRNFNYHHAIDASIIALVINNNKYIARLLTIADNEWKILNDHQMEQKFTGEVKEITDLDFKKNIMAHFVSKIIKEKINLIVENNYELVQFSRKIKIMNNAPLFDQTLYGLKQTETNEQDKVYKVVKINLIKEKNKELQKYFENPIVEEGRNKYSVLMAQSHLKEFNNLKEIFKKYNLKNSGSAFIDYMNDLNSNFPELVTKKMIDNAIATNRVIYLDLNNMKTRYYKDLRIVEKSLIPINFKYNNGKSFKDTNTTLFSLVYKNENNNYNSIPINFLTYKFGSKNNNLLDENIYNKGNLQKYKENLKISFSEKPLFAIKQGTILRRKNPSKNWFENLYYVSGISKQEDMDTKYKLTNLIKTKPSDKENKEEVKTIISKLTNPLLKEFDIIYLDELGNEYKANIPKLDY